MLTAKQWLSLSQAVIEFARAYSDKEAGRPVAPCSADCEVLRGRISGMVAGWLEPLRPRYPAKGELPELGVRVNFCLREKPEEILFGWKARRSGPWCDTRHGYPERNILCWWPAPTAPESEP